jgi:galactokinase/mevalonate kinase-like predicted kinase
MRYQLSVPARINILGNPSDANEGDFATISAAVDLFAGALVEPSERLVLEVNSREALDCGCSAVAGTAAFAGQPGQWEEFSTDCFPLPYCSELDLLKAAVNRLHRYSPEFRQKVQEQGVRLAAWSEVPRQSGLGGSSLFVLLALAGLRRFYELDPRKHNDYILAELTQRVEAKELGITCGFADRYVPLFGGIAYLDYHGKLHHADIGEEPLVVYERLDAWVDDLPLVAICTGIQHDSGDVHSRMRPRYIQEYDAWVSRGGQPPPLVRLMQGAWNTAWRGKIALLEGDLETFGALMNTNHRLVDEMMTYCGFEDGAGWANNLFIHTALENGALGAKLTGAGSGGSVFALTPPGKDQALFEIWKQTAIQVGLEHAHIYRPHICHQGLVIQASSSE